MEENNPIERAPSPCRTQFVMAEAWPAQARGTAIMPIFETGVIASPMPIYRKHIQNMT